MRNRKLLTLALLAVLISLIMDLSQETNIYKAHLEEWRKTHLSEFVLIKNQEVIGFYSSLGEAFSFGTMRFGLDDFFIKQITPTDNVNVSLFGRSLQAI